MIADLLHPNADIGTAIQHGIDFLKSNSHEIVLKLTSGRWESIEPMSLGARELEIEMTSEGEWDRVLFSHALRTVIDIATDQLGYSLRSFEEPDAGNGTQILSISKSR